MNWNYSMLQLLNPYFKAIAGACKPCMSRDILKTKAFLEEALPDVVISDAVMIAWSAFLELPEHLQKTIIDQAPKSALPKFQPQHLVKKITDRNAWMTPEGLRNEAQLYAVEPEKRAFMNDPRGNLNDWLKERSDLRR